MFVIEQEDMVELGALNQITYSETHVIQKKKKEPITCNTKLKDVKDWWIQLKDYYATM